MANPIRFRSIAGYTEDQQFLDYLEDPEAFNLGRFILDNYAIVASNLDLRPAQFWRALKGCRVLLLGESHRSDEDRKDNGQLTQLFWQSGRTALASEGITSKLLKYVDPKIAREAVCWDLTARIVYMPVRYAFKVVDRTDCALVKEFNALMAIEEPIDFCDRLLRSPLVDSIDVFSQVDISTLKNAFLSLKKEIPLVEEVEAYLELFYARKRKLFYIISEDLLMNFQAQCDTANQVKKRINESRDEMFVETVAEKLTQFQRVITHSGGAHNWKTSKMVQFLDQQKIPYLSLISKRSYSKLRDRMERNPHEEALEVTRKLSRKLEEAQKLWMQSLESPPSE